MKQEDIIVRLLDLLGEDFYLTFARSVVLGTWRWFVEIYNTAYVNGSDDTRESVQEWYDPTP